VAPFPHGSPACGIGQRHLEINKKEGVKIGKTCGNRASRKAA